MKRSILASATLLLAVGASPTAFAHNGYDDAATVRCESADGRQRFCQADVSGGVRLSRQLSQAACIEGQSWGSDGRGIWVDRGCRAEFEVQRAYPGGGYPGGGYPGNGSPGNGHPGNGYPGDDNPGNRYPGNAYGNTFRCESTDGRWRQCAVNGRRVELVQQLSERPCVRGRTWGTDNQGVWVSGGCRAEFRADGRGDGWGNAQPQLLRCESGDGRQRVCPANIGAGVRMVRQLSRTQCIEGTSWGRTRDGIWVDRGCRAEFETGHRRGNGRYGDDD